MSEYTEADTHEIFYGDHPDFDRQYVHEENGDKHRWSLEVTRVYRHTASGQHYAVTMLIADEGSSDDHEPAGAPVKVEPCEKTVTVWEPVDS
ncbi:MAG: hypothetical protein M0R28_17765 [Pigmentiphaga sp.]|nr:hypothetical protein [Pigmentiphaga sp.]